MDQFYPDTAKNIVKILNVAGINVEYNCEQTCCGKFAFYSGFKEEAKELGEKFLKDFPNDRPIIGVSASCVAYIKTRYQELFYNTASHLEFKRLVPNIYEFTDFLVNKINHLNFGSEFPHKVVYQDCCSSLRDLHLHDEGRRLLSAVKGLELVEMQRPELCCGFGSGFFSIQHEAISVAMAERKIQDAISSGAEYIATNDMGCLMQLSSCAKKQGYNIEVVHIADILAQGI
ncbi:MAG: (Fe-S)-binding protein [Bacteroidales bacterium]|nr:(Fe-S)-binding protein [Bacteroidales bacterium]MBR7175965.1 (Fe-S)-binding protein [Bacteroidales bacterium]